MKQKQTTDTNVAGFFVGFVLLMFMVWGLLKSMDTLVYLNSILIAFLAIGTYTIRMKFR